jgi:cytochrome c551/c552
MKATLSGLGFYTDMADNPGLLDSLVTHLTTLKGGVDSGGGEKAAAAQVLVMPNFNLTDDELNNLVTFLLGLQAHTVTWPQKSFAEQNGAAAGVAPAGMALAGKSGEELVSAAGCIACHKLDGPDRLVGPSLWDIGARKDADYIRESILHPDKVVVEGYPQGVMKATMDSQGFYQNISLDALDKLVEYLASLKGKS